MKLLNYRSLSSMLKYQDAGQLMSLATLLESASWQKSFTRVLSQTRPVDFEIRKLMIVAPKKNLLRGVVIKNHKPVTAIPLTGLVMLGPAEGFKPVQKAGLVALLAQAAGGAEAESFYISSHQLRADFGRQMAKIYSGDAQPALKIAGHEFFDWQQAHRLDGETETSAVKKMAKTHPVFNWWSEAENLGRHEQRTVSLNLIDLVEQLIGKSLDTNIYCHNLAKELKNELFNRYCQYPAVKRYFASQLDNSTDIIIGDKVLAPALISGPG